MKVPCKDCICLPICRIKYLNKYKEYKKIYGPDTTKTKYNSSATKSRSVGELTIGCIFITDYIINSSYKPKLINLVHEYMIGE